MDYFNERLGFLRHILPDGYIASSIADFLESKDDIPAPKTPGVINFLLKGKSRTSVMVDFLNVELAPFEVSGKKAGWTLNDGQYELFVYPQYPECKPTEMGRYPSGNYKMVRAFYVPAHRRIHLVRAKGFQGAAQGKKRHTDLELRILTGETVLVNRRLRVV